MIVVYAATVAENAENPVVNTVTAQANSGTSTGEIITGTAEETINLSPFASVAFIKTADKETVVAGESLTYTFTLTNTGNTAVDSLVFTDALPPEFTVTSVTYTVDGVTTIISPEDYTITPPNTISIPSEESTVVIGVPASDAEGPGVAIITITGTVA